MSTDPPAASGPELAGLAIDDWLEIVPEEGVFLLKVGKAEIGTGIRTALLQVAAEELGVPLDRVRVAPLGTGRSPDEGYTAGSRSIKESVPRIRQVAAEARALLLARAEERLGVPSGSLEIVDGKAAERDGSASIPLELLLDAGGFREVTTGLVPTRSPEEFRIIGRDTPRIDALGKVTGAPAYVTDVRLPGMVHGRMIRPPRNGAHLLSVDTSELDPDIRVVRKNDLLAVVGPTEASVVLAARLIRATWSDDALLPPQEELYERIRASATEDQVLRDQGDLGSAFDDQDGVIERSYEWPFQAHASIGPACAVADVSEVGVVVHAAAQGVYPLQRGLAALLGVDPCFIRVEHAEGPGCYGHNGADDVAADAVILSREVGRPVRVQWSREDEHVWARKGPAMVVRLRARLDPAGHIAAVESEVWTPTHGGRAFRPERFTAGHLMAGIAEPPDEGRVGGDRNAALDYDIPTQRVTVRWQKEPILPSSSLRALGAVPTTFANESMMDELAMLAEADPVEFRLRHLTDPRAREVLERVAEVSEWGQPLPPGEGMGVAFARYENTGAYLAAVAHVAVDPSCRTVEVRRFFIVQDCGLIINPDGVRNQVEGNAVQSLSRALMEEVRWEAEGITSRDWESYPILRFAELPRIEIVLIDRVDQPPLGVGEPASITTAPAVANAIAAACGLRIRRIPLAPEGVLRAGDAA